MAKRRKAMAVIVFVLLVLCLAGGYFFRGQIYNGYVAIKYTWEFRSIKNEILEQYPQLEDETVSDFEKTNILRDWAYGKIVQAEDSESYNFQEYWLDSTTLSVGNFMALTNAYESFTGGGFCDGCAFYLANLYEAFGYDAAVLGTAVNAEASHMSVLVKLTDLNIWIVQDPTYNLTYENHNGEPVSIDQIILAGLNNDLKSIFCEYGGTQLRYTLVSRMLEITPTSNIENIQPGTCDFYPVSSATPLIQENGYIYLRDMRHPKAFLKQIEETLKSGISTQFPNITEELKAEHLYLFPVSIFGNNQEYFNQMLLDLQELVKTAG